MAVSPPGDIVLDVARAADPAAIDAARTRLEKAAASNPANSVPFDMAASRAALQRADIEAARAPVPEEFVKFEAAILQTFVQSMLPKESENVYGHGLSGDMWKSMLSQHLAEAVAKQGGIGIAGHVVGDHYMDGEKKVPVRGVSSDPEKAQHDAQALMSSALVHEIQRRAAQTIGSNGLASASENSRT